MEENERFPIVKVVTQGKVIDLDNPGGKIDSKMGFGVDVWIDDVKVYACQEFKLEAFAEDFSMVTIKFPAIVKSEGIPK